jgi:HEAT repeat protein
MAALPTILQVLKKDHGEVQEHDGGDFHYITCDSTWWVEVISDLSVLGPEAVPSLIEILKSKKEYSAGVRYTAATVLEVIGPAAREAVPTLTEALKDENPVIRQTAARVLEKINEKK